jgi:PST family polysaccharide transporter
MLASPGVAFLIATSDWIVRLVLGPQWDESARIFAILGFAALLMPILNTLGWLYVTQGRTRDMLYIGVIDAFVKILSVVIGLYWGITGVAVAVAARYYIEMPLCIWFCCRKGPIRTVDFLRTYFYAAILSISVLTTLSIFRRLSRISDPVAGVTISFAATIGIVLIILWALPEGRALLKVIANFLFTKAKGYIDAGVSRVYKKVN